MNIINPFRFANQLPPTPAYFDGAIVHSLRQFFNWSNAVFQIRRSSDDAEAYVFFDSNGTISTSSLISTSSNTTPDATTFGTWLGSDDGYVKQWFGMTDDNVLDVARRVLQTDTALQPLLASGGTIYTKNGNPAVYTPGSKYLGNTTAWSELDDGNDFTQITVAATTNANLRQEIFGNRTGVSFDGFNTYIDSSSLKRVHYLRNGTNWITEYAAQTTTLDQRLLTAVVNDTNEELTSWYNGTEIDTLNFGSGSWFNSAVWFFRDRGATLTFQGYAQEFILFGSDKEADLTDIHSDINTYYSIY